MNYRHAKTQITRNGFRLEVEGEWDYKRERFADDSDIRYAGHMMPISPLGSFAGQTKDILKAASHEYHERQWGGGHY